MGEFIIIMLSSPVSLRAVIVIIFGIILELVYLPDIGNKIPERLPLIVFCQLKDISPPSTAILLYHASLLVLEDAEYLPK